MKFHYLLLGVLLAALALASVATASTNYDIVQGLYDNIITPSTTWTGAAATQVGNDGWKYEIGPSLYPWSGPYGASYAFPSALTAPGWSLMGWEHSGDHDNAYGWSAQTSGGSYPSGYICNSNETAEQLQNTTAMGTTVAFRQGWTYNNDYQLAAVWTASTAGNATASFTCYAASGLESNVPDARAGSGCQFQLGLYDSSGNFVSQLAWCEVLGTVNTGVGNGLALSAATAVNAGDSIVLISRSDTYSLHNVAQQNGAVSGGITLTSGDVPEPGSMLALGCGLISLAGMAIRRRK